MSMYNVATMAGMHVLVVQATAIDLTMRSPTSQSWFAELCCSTTCTYQFSIRADDSDDDQKVRSVSHTRRCCSIANG